MPALRHQRRKRLRCRRAKARIADTVGLLIGDVGPGGGIIWTDQPLDLGALHQRRQGRMSSRDLPGGDRAVGVIGPTRLNYSRIVPMVDYTARTLSRLIG